MNLCLSSYVLLAGLFLSVSALTPEECQPMVTPQSLADRSVVYGHYNALAGNADSKEMNYLLKMYDSTWMTTSASTESPNEVLVSEGTKMNGKCFRARFNLSIENDSILRMSLPTWSAELQMLPSIEGCITYIVNYTANDFDQFLQMLNISTPVGRKKLHSRAVYLMCREETLKDSVLEHFKQQASCLGFSGELSFIHDPKKGSCSEGEGVMMDL